MKEQVSTGIQERREHLNEMNSTCYLLLTQNI